MLISNLQEAAGNFSSKVAGQAGRFVVFRRNLYAPRDWVPDVTSTAQVKRAKPRMQLIGTEYWVVEVGNAALATAAIMDEDVSVTRINDRNIIRKHKMGFVWANERGAHEEGYALNRRAQIMAEWVSRCGFWPFD